MDRDGSLATTVSPVPGGTSTGRVVAVCASPGHLFSKQTRPRIRLLEGLGVEGDAHAGATVQHRSRVRRNPTEANLRQVHLVHAELFEEVARNGHQVRPGDLGENVTTTGVDLLGLPVGTVLHLGDTAAVELTGLRNPCFQIDDFQPGLLKQVLGRAADGSVVRRSGVMAVVLSGGDVRPGDEVTVVLPREPHQRLAPV
jgi:MOSC domain-containing protein YiiM